jgi:hypothetical protein
MAVASRHHVEVGTGMDRLVRADRHLRGEPLQPRILPGRHRLLEQVDPKLDQNRLHHLDEMRVPALVGIDDQPRFGRRIAHRADLRVGQRRVDFHLDQRRVGDPAPRQRHRRRAVDPHRQRALDPPRLTRADRLRDVRPGQPRLQVPQGAIHCVASRARGQQRQQFRARRPRLDPRAHALDRRQRALDALAIAQIGHALAAPLDSALAQHHRDHVRLRLHAAADPERPR